MPDGWLRESLGDLIVLEYGKGLKEDARDGGQYPVVSSAGVVGHHSHPLVESAPVIVVGRKGSAGTVHWSDAPCWPIDTTFWVRPVTERLDPEFLYLLLQHADLPAICAQTGVPGLSRDRAYEVRVDVPPLVVQRRVVDLVDAVDTYAAAAAARAAAAQAIRSALLAELLVGGDGWVATDLGSVAEWFSGGTPKAGTREFYAEGTVPWVVIGDLNDGPITSTATKITEAGLAEIGGRTAPPGSVLVSMYGTIGRLGIAETDLATNQAIAWGVVSDSVLPEYLFLWLSFTQPELDAKARGATQRNINRRIIRDHHILVPALAEQQRIVDLVGAAGDEADRAAEAEEAALSLRSALLDELLSGECEIPGSYDELVGLVA